MLCARQGVKIKKRPPAFETLLVECGRNQHFDEEKGEQSRAQRPVTRATLWQSLFIMSNEFSNTHSDG